jgi:hypothetical protein
MVLLATLVQLAMGQADGGIEAVESGITVRLAAPIKTDGTRKVFMEFQTNDVYECSNFALENDSRLDGSKILIGVRGVRRTSPCADGMGPAKARIDLTDLAKGEYKVRVTINRQVFKAKLSVADSCYDFRIPKENPLLFRIYNGRMNLIPDDVVWGKCEYVDAKLKAEANSFLGEMEKAGAKKTNLPVGSYDEFYLHYPGSTDPKLIQGDHYEYPFVYGFTGDLAVVQEIMNAFRGKIKITVKNTKGQVLTNF